MKHTIYMSLIVVLVAMFAACTPMNEQYKEFLEDSDVLYPGRVDSIKVLTGIGTIGFDVLMSSDPKVNKAVIYWNSRLDSCEFEILPEDIGEHKILQIDSIQEDVHSFEIITYDKDGLASVSQELVAKVYGPVFEERLNHRGVSNAITTGTNELTINWSLANSDYAIVDVNMRYIDTAGQEKTVYIPTLESVTILKDYAPNQAFVMSTTIKPDSTFVEDYYMGEKSVKVEASLDWTKPKWTVSAKNDKNLVYSGRVVSRIKDGSLDGFNGCWNGKYNINGNYAGYDDEIDSYYLVAFIDLGEVYTLAQVYMATRTSYDGQYTQSELYMSDSIPEDLEWHPEDWSLVQRITGLEKVADLQYRNIATRPTTRYVAFKFAKSWMLNPNTTDCVVTEVGFTDEWNTVLVPGFEDTTDEQATEPDETTDPEGTEEVTEE